MKSLLTLLVLVTLTACSQNNNPSLTFESQNLSVPAESGASSSYSFGESIELNATVADKTFTFSKSASATEAAGSTVALSSPDFSVVSATGCNKDLVKTSDKCYVKVRFLKSKTAGAYSGVLQVGSPGALNEITLSANVVGAADPSLSLVLLDGSATAVDPLDFGALNKNTSVTKTFTLTNNGTATATLAVASSGAGYTLSNNTCTTSLLKSKSCYFKITFSAGAGTAVDETKVGVLTLTSTLDYDMTAVVRGTPVVVGSPDIRFIVTSEISLLDLGPATKSQTVSKIVTVKNQGTAAAPTPGVTLSSIFTLSSNTCTGSLAVNASCYIKVAFMTSTVPVADETRSGDLVAFGKTLPVSVLVKGEPPPVADVRVYESTNELTSVSFGPVAASTTLSKILSVKNIGNATSSSLGVVVTGSGFTLSSNGCSSTLAAGASCSIRITFTAGTPLQSEARSGNLAVAGKNLALSATAEAGSPLIKFYESSVLTSSVNFGSVSQGTVQKTVIVKNEGNNVAVIPALSLGSSFSLATDTCSNKTLAIGGNCSLKISFSKGSLNGGNYDHTLSILGSDVSLHAEIPSSNYTLTLDVPDRGHMHFSSPYFQECSGYGGSNQCSADLPAGSVVMVEFQHDSQAIIANGWINCPNEIPGGPGQFFCEVTLNSNITLGFNVSPNNNYYNRYIDVGYSDYGVIQSSDGMINCGNGNYQCNAFYNISPASLDFSINAGNNIIYSVQNYGNNYQYYGNGITSFQVDLSQTDYHYIYADIQPNPEGRFVVNYPQSGRVFSSDGNINCGNDNYNCEYQYSPSPFSVTLNFDGMGSNFTLNEVYNQGTNFQSYGNSFPIEVQVAGQGEINIQLDIQEDRRGQVQVQSPPSGRFTSSDGFINCGAGNSQCFHQYPVDTTSVSMSLVGVAANYNVTQIYHYGDSYQNFGTNLNFSINPSSGRIDLYVNMQQIPSATLKAVIRGGNEIERVNISYSSTNDNCEGTCSYIIPGGTVVTMTATSNGGKTFSSWMNCPSASGNVCTVTMNQNREIKAVFDYAYTVSSSPIPDQQVIPGGSKLPLGNLLYFINYNAGNLSVVDLLNSATTFIPVEAGTDWNFLSVNENEKIAFRGTSYYHFHNGSLIPLNIPVPSGCQQKNQYPSKSEGNKILLECVVSNTNPYKYYSYLITIDPTGVNSTYKMIIDGMDVVGFNEVVLVDFNFSTEESVIYKQSVGSSQRGFYKYNSLGQQISSLMNTPSQSFIVFTSTSAKLSNGKIVVPMYNGSSAFWLLDPSLSSIQQMTPFGGGVSMLKENHLFFVHNNQPRALDLLNTTTASSPVILSSPVSLSCSNFGYQFDEIFGSHGGWRGLGFCYDGRGFDVSVNAQGNALNVVQHITSSKWAMTPYQTKLTQNTSLVSIQSYHYSNDGALAKQNDSGIVMRVNHQDPRKNRELYRFPVPSLVDRPGSDTYFAIYSMKGLSDGSIFLQHFQRDYPGGTEVNQYYNTYLVPNP